MPTRRQTLIGLGNTLVGGVAIGSGAFDNVIAQPGGDLRVVPDAGGPPDGIKLIPGRDDEAYVVTTEDGRVEEIVLTSVGATGDGLNTGAITRFEDIVAIRKEPPGPPIEELYFEFAVTDEGLDNSDPTTDDIESVLFIASSGGDVPGDGTHDFLEETDHGQTGADKLTPNEELPFGIGVDLGDESALQDLPSPEKFGIQLRIEAKQKDPGPPNSPGPGN